ncbi:inorganic phosphate transporter [Clostridium sp. JN-9]|uniref:inorganic phosphate transporter n=1 Tax=Clostridium sp. JN-9 TaxID=2507159 RepID=UPI000FFE0C4F|nr:inorganic phosphate transporter [Clostridium sp. JN-9]QAT40129.1 inorganic phosphate transporter [Clostridium sp. JN-9]
MLSLPIILTIVIVVLAVFFDLINGFHDCANAIATSVSTRVLTLRQAVIMSAFFNLVGAFISEKVAETIGNGLVDPKSVTQYVIIAALIAAIIWDLITWLYGIPSSSSHALIGGLLGSAIVYSFSFKVVYWQNFFDKVVLWLFLSPIIGFIAGFTIMHLLNFILRNQKPAFVTRFFSKAQIVSAALMAFNHGSNDAQKSMGIIAMALLSGGFINTFYVPLWVKISCATAMALGTTFGGKRIIKTVGHNMAKLAPVNGFAAETGAAAVIFTATMLNSPVSTTHIISTSIMGVAASKRLSAVKWSLAKDIVLAWVLTIPICFLIGAAVMYLFLLIS